jgi:hypothetical protein
MRACIKALREVTAATAFASHTASQCRLCCSSDARCIHACVSR